MRMGLGLVAGFLLAHMSIGYAQSPPGQERVKKQSIGKTCTERLDAYRIEGSLRRKYWWHCWRRRGK